MLDSGVIAKTCSGIGILFLFILVLNAFGGAADEPAVVWLEAEHFNDQGGWTQDAQFIDQMGSPYLLAVGLGKPVRDATARVAVPRPGKYRLWCGRAIGSRSTIRGSSAWR